jgi:glycosyltransferase involved in cell wall biosynthesis
LDGQNGYLIQENNAAYFVEKIQYLVSEPNLYSEMSEFARQFSKKFDIANYIDVLVEYYKQLLFQHDHNRKL